MRLCAAAVIGLVAGLGLGYCEIWMRYYERGVHLYQFLLLLCNRSLLGCTIGVLIYFRKQISAAKAIVLVLLIGLGLTEGLNFLLFR